jgi:hypothetical protein
MANKYYVIVKAVLDKVDLQSQLNNISTKTVYIKTNFNLDQNAINQQVQRWNNSLAKMEALHPDAFKSAAVQTQVAEFQKLIGLYEGGKIPIGDVRTQLDNVNTSLVQSSAAMKNVTKDGLSFGSMIDLAVKKVVIWSIATTALYGALKQLKEGIQYLTDLDEAMTDVRVVTGMSEVDIGILASQYNKLATELGATTLQVANGSLEWLRQGKTVQETAELMKSTMMMSKLGNMESAEATEYLTSTLNGFNLSAEESVSVVDKLVNFARTYSNIWILSLTEFKRMIKLENDYIG